KKNNADMHDMLVDYYVYGITFMKLARKHGCSDTCVGKRLQKAEGVIDGMLMMLDVRLEMDRYVSTNYSIRRKTASSRAGI
ncbi:antitermination protein, partial [Escherichia coli]|nr:antitermination protein [Escherichia coli]